MEDNIATYTSTTRDNKLMLGGRLLALVAQFAIV
jgi:hypothetical protein